MSTYSDLVRLIERRLARTDLADEYPEFVRLGENDIVRSLRVREMYAEALVPFIDGAAELPDDLVAVQEVRPDNRRDISIPFAQASQLRFGERGNQGASSQLWSEYSDRLQIRPAPASTVWGTSVPGELLGTSSGNDDFTASFNLYWIRYIARPPALSPENETNFLFSKYENIYLFAAMEHAMLRIGRDTEVDRYRAMRIDAITEQNRRHEFERYGDADIQMLPPFGDGARYGGYANSYDGGN